MAIASTKQAILKPRNDEGSKPKTIDFARNLRRTAMTKLTIPMLKAPFANPFIFRSPPFLLWKYLNLLSS